MEYIGIGIMVGVGIYLAPAALGLLAIILVGIINLFRSR